MWWWLFVLLAAFGLFMVVRGMLARGAETAGRSDGMHVVAEAPAPIAAPTPTDAIPVRAAESLVYKCVATNGAVSYQSDPCASNQVVNGTYAAEPDTVEDQARARLLQDERARRAARVSHIAGTDRSARYVASAPGYDARRATCDAAKASRDEVLRRVGLSRTYDLLQRLDEQVREACKGLQ